MALPQWFVVGPQKTGSAWLRNCLLSHPNVFVPTEVNETFFFDRYFSRGTDWYERYFRDASDRHSLGEVAPTYFASDNAARRIADTCPHAQIITILRNPIDRAWSMYRYLLQKGDTRAGFRQALSEYPTILSDGLYAKHLERFEHCFDESRMLNLIHDDIADDPSGVLVRVFDFLGLDEIDVPIDVGKKVNEGQVSRYFLLSRWTHRLSRTLHRYQMHRVVNIAKKAGAKKLVLKNRASAEARKMSESDRALCRQYYEEDVAALSRKLGRDMRHEWFAEGVEARFVAREQVAIQ